MKHALIEILIYVSVLAALYGICYGLCRAYNAPENTDTECGEVET